MSRLGVNIPIHFWANAAKSATCSFPSGRGATRYAAWTVIIAATLLELLAIHGQGPIGLPLMFVALMAPPAALFFLSQLRRYRLLEIAVANMWQGLAFYDAGSRLVLYNAQFCAMLGLSRADVRRAKTHRDIVELLVRAGNCHGLSAEQVWREDMVFIARRQTALAYIDLPNNRTIAESHEPIVDGGWIRTYADVTGRRQVEARIVHMARHDALTDLPNRVLFYEKLEHALAGASDVTPFALLFLDLDRFKAVNDTSGHAVGDQLLRQVADRLRRAVRDNDTVARLGGDEFAIIRVGVEDTSQVREFAKRLVAIIGDPYEIEGALVSIGASLGITFAPADGVAADELLRNADVALYRAKSSGRGAFCLFMPDGEAQDERRRILEADPC